MADIYLEIDIDDSLRALVDNDSDERSVSAHPPEGNEIQVEVHKEENSEDKG